MRTFTFHSVSPSGEIMILPLQAVDLTKACIEFDLKYPDHEVGIVLFHPEPSDHRPVVNWGEWVKMS